MKQYHSIFVVLLLFAVTSAVAQNMPTAGGAEQLTNAPENNAPTLPQPLTRQAVRDVLSSLDDAQARQLLLAELDKKIDQREQELAASTQLSITDALAGWATALGNSLAFAVSAAPIIPPAIANSFASFKKQRGNKSLWRVPVTLLISLLTGLVAVFLTKWLTRGYRSKLENTQPSNLWSQVGIICRRLFFQGTGLIAFLLVAYAADALLNRTAPVDSSLIQYIIGSIGWTGLAILLARFVLSPARPELRLCTMDNKTARFLTWRTGLIFGWSAFFVGLMAWLQQFDWPYGAVRLGFWISLIFYGLIALTFWQARKGITQMVLGHGDGGPAWRRFAELWPIIAIVFVLFQWMIVELFVATGNLKNLSITSMNFSLAILMAMPLFELAIRALVEAIWPNDPEQQPALQAAHKQTQAGLVRFGRIIVVVLVVIAMAEAWGVDLQDLASQGVGARLAGAMIEIVLIAIVAYGLWELINIVADRQIAIERVTMGLDSDDAEQAEGEGGQGGTRLGTLMPLVRGTAQVIIAVMTILAILSQIGVNVTPLLAGAGIVGLAVGFGSQALVKDIFSGIFFLIDDAFRKGEYIDIDGTVKGTVEKISIRSMQLRHHKGPLNTIPFGEIRSLTNYSRDWVVMKLPLRLTYDTDANKVRKMIKKLGQELLDHPEIGHLFLEPLKSQGVLAMEDSAMIMRIKFTTKPGDQFIVRRYVLDEIHKLFNANGIRFASREVTVRISDDSENHSTAIKENAAAAVAHSIIEQEQEQGKTPAPGSGV